MRILVIGDDERQIRTLRRILPTHPGLYCLPAMSAGAAIELINDYDPDVVFIDHHFSEGGDGIEVVDHFSGAGVEFYTTTSDERVHGQYFERGVRVYSKSSFNELIDTISEIIRRVRDSQGSLRR